ncbi:MAG: adenylate/guanylate cyclase domain-containing protein, partial [Candidatus Riflebacteria bacterium]
RMEIAYHERRRLERFMSEEAIAAIRKESHDLTFFRSQKVEKTILFSHIRDFNALVTSLEPDMLISMLNHFFSSMEAPIKNSGGQIDKYIGDAIMAVFSDDGAEPAEKRAARAAVEMMQRLGEFNSGFIKTNGLQTIKIGIGISTGTVISGKIGSNDSRQDFTVIGDRVNFAARLESITHKLPESGIFIDHATFVRCESSSIEEGEVIVKGKTFAEKIYRVIANG